MSKITEVGKEIAKATQSEYKGYDEQYSTIDFLNYNLKIGGEQDIDENDDNFFQELEEKAKKILKSHNITGFCDNSEKGYWSIQILEMN